MKEILIEELNGDDVLTDNFDDISIPNSTLIFIQILFKPGC